MQKQIGSIALEWGTVDYLHKNWVCGNIFLGRVLGPGFPTFSQQAPPGGVWGGGLRFKSAPHVVREHG